MLSPFSSPSIEILQGRALKRLVRAANATERALLAADLEAGRVIVERPTAPQARALAGAGSACFYTARWLSPMDRNAVRGGRLKLSEVRRRREPSDAKLDRLIARYGANRVMAALDRITRPAVAAE